MAKPQYFQWLDAQVPKNYDTAIDSHLYSSYRAGDASTEISIQGVTYIINFNSLTQSLKSNPHRWRRIKYIGPPLAGRSSASSPVLSSSSIQPSRIYGEPPTAQASLAPEAYATYTIKIESGLFALVPDPVAHKAVMLTKVWETPPKHPNPGISVIRYSSVWYKHTDRGLYPKSKTFSRYDDRDETPPVWPGTEEHTSSHSQSQSHGTTASQRSPAQASASSQDPAQQTPTSTPSSSSSLPQNPTIYVNDDSLYIRIRELERQNNELKAINSGLEANVSQMRDFAVKLQTEAKLMHATLVHYKIPLLTQVEEIPERNLNQSGPQSPPNPQDRHGTHIAATPQYHPAPLPHSPPVAAHAPNTRSHHEFDPRNPAPQARAIDHQTLNQSHFAQPSHSHPVGQSATFNGGASQQHYGSSNFPPHPSHSQPVREGNPHQHEQYGYATQPQHYTPPQPNAYPQQSQNYHQSPVRGSPHPPQSQQPYWVQDPISASQANLDQHEDRIDSPPRARR